MPRATADGEPQPLEVIDLEPELGPQTPRRAPSPRRRRAIRAVAVMAVAAAALALVVAVRRDPPHRDAGKEPDASTVGRFYPALESGSTTVVLPSGLRIELSGGLEQAIGGLGAIYAGSLGSISFRVAHSAPSDLFDSLGSGAITTAVPVAGADARAADLTSFGGRLAVMSTGEWTLVAFLSDDQRDAAVQLAQMASWRLRATPNGAVIDGPVADAVGTASVMLSRNPGASGRRVELTDDNCAGTPVRTESALGETAAGYWCEQGVYVRIEGPKAYVERAVQDLQVRVDRDA